MVSWVMALKVAKKDSFDNVDAKGKIVICYIYAGTYIEMGVYVKIAGGAAMIIRDTFMEGSTTFSDVMFFWYHM